MRGVLIERDALRYTPAGVPLVKFRVAHDSTQVEAGIERRVDCEVEALAFGTEARLLSGAALGAEVRISGFLDRRSRRGRQTVLHATGVDFVTQENP
ncbi:MAG: primosomal replication protein N [Burkholderiales bacterium]|nr:primosomal replication protein N [Burkholderiales bacterium]